MRIRHADRPGIARARLQHHPRTTQRPNVRIHGRRSRPRRHSRGQPHEVRASPEYSRRHEALRGERSGKRAQRSERGHQQARHPRNGLAGVSDRHRHRKTRRRHVHRILRSEFASGIVDHPVKKSVIDVEAGLETSRKIAEQSIVLLKNSSSVLPLDPAKIHSIAIIGAHADAGMISGGGSAQVDPPGQPSPHWKEHVWFPTSPLKAVSAAAPGANVQFESGADRESAAALAKKSDVAIVFTYQWTSEDMDLPNLSLPENQDALIDQVAAANPKTIVVLETGTAVTMPWLDKVSGVLEAWYAGSKGHEAVANILFGRVNPSAKLP